MMRQLRAFLAALELFVLAQGRPSKLFVLQDLTIQAPKQPSVCCAPPAPTSLQLDMPGHRAQIVRLAHTARRLWVKVITNYAIPRTG